MDPRVKAVLALVGNAVVFTVAAWPVLEQVAGDYPVKAYAWRLLARCSGLLAEQAGRANLAAQKRYYEEVSR